MTGTLRTSETPTTVCGNCGSRNDRATSAHGHAPKPGDISVCYHCGLAGQFDEDLIVQPFTADEFLALPDDVRMAVSRLVKNVQKHTKPPEPSREAQALEDWERSTGLKSGY